MSSSSSFSTSTFTSLDNSSSIDYKLIVKGLVYTIVVFSLAMSTYFTKENEKGKHASLVIVTFLFSIILLGLFFGFPKVIKNILFTPLQAILMIYIILLIIVFNYSEKDTLKKYAYYIFPVIFIIVIFLFYSNVISATDFKYKFMTKETFKTKICILFICLLTYIILLNNELSSFITTSTGSVITLFIMIITIGFLFLLYVLLDNDPLDKIKKKLDGISPLITVGLSSFFMVTVAVLAITWLVINMTNLYSSSNIMAFIVNLIIFLAMLGLIYKFLSITSFYKKSPLIRVVVGVIFYIPCLVYGILEKIYTLLPSIPGFSGFSFFKKTGPITGLPTATSAADAESSKHIGMLFFIIFLYLFYFIIYPYISVKVSKQGGLLLVNEPIAINSEKILGSYQNLNQTDHLDYKYGLSFWLYLDSYSPHTNEKSDSYTSVLNYGDKPNILYNPVKNTLRVVMKLDTDKPDDTTNYLSQKTKRDENGNVILYERTGILLQKWNNIIINYNGGTFDIFYNAELVKTHIEVVPYMTYDNLVVGTENGLYGSICNVNYFKNPISIMQIYYLYNLVKNNTPPVVSGEKVTVIKVKNDYVKIPTLSFETSTVENTIDTTTEESGENLNEATDKLTELNPYQKNYLSLKWYFLGNRDNQTI